MDWRSHIRSLVDAGAPIGVIAAHMQVSPSAVSEILAGRTKSPRADAAFRLARVNAQTPLKRDSDGRVVAFAVPLDPVETGKAAALEPAT
ncbi:hypothetical protein [Pseudoxanthomonas winnipegensis]|uniref:Uncharacterized protein n=1 Tax=Pseudoxanthomonas winnipegensis TaxID=2480810 RepID=A0A4Q8LAD1_9GAMM|nr:hypothetical protein [Pseudoxanthomonas winnipegensis]RZZ81425.1 hypothetical protein EA663_20600 [Pseudoxanthomonas winnipegensis]TAA25420.1 hypothetical protein EA660_08140 [Pseudoxanthomonas winnipegensis]